MAGQAGAMRYREPAMADRGKQLAKQLFPELRLIADGNSWDYLGYDAWWGKLPIQIKLDSRIALSKKIYHEVYEKTANCPDQPWRLALGKVPYYIFITETPDEIVAIRIAIDILAEAERNKTLASINPNGGANTSLGFLIPWEELKDKGEIKRKPRN